MQTLKNQEIITNNRETLSFVSRMIVSTSEISASDELITINVNREVSDLAASKKVQAELVQALTAEFGKKQIKIRLV